MQYRDSFQKGRILLVQCLVVAGLGCFTSCISAQVPFRKDTSAEICRRDLTSSRGVAHCWIALEQGQYLSDPIGESRARLRVASEYRSRGFNEQAISLLDEALSLAQGKDEDLIASILAVRGQSRVALWNFDGGRQDLVEASYMAKINGKEVLEARALQLLARLDLSIGRLRTSRGYVERLLELYGQPTPAEKEELRELLDDVRTKLGEIFPQQQLLGVLGDLFKEIMEKGRLDAFDRSPSVKVDEAEVEFLMHLECIEARRMSGSSPRSSCRSKVSRDRIRREIQDSHVGRSLIFPVLALQQQSQPLRVSDRLCKMFLRSDALFDLADLRELQGEQVGLQRKRAWGIWNETSGAILRLFEDSLAMNVEMIKWETSQLFGHVSERELKADSGVPTRSPADRLGVRGSLAGIFAEDDRVPSLAILSLDPFFDCGHWTPKRRHVDSFEQPVFMLNLSRPMFHPYKHLETAPQLALENARQARVEAEEGNDIEALRLYEQALRWVGETFDMLSVQPIEFGAKSAKLTGEVVEFLVSKGLGDLAFEFSEQARAHDLHRRLRSAAPLIQDSLSASEYSLLLQLSREIARQQQELEDARNKYTEEGFRADMRGEYEEKIARAEGRREDFLAKLAKQNPEIAAVLTRETVRLEEIQRRILPPGTSMVVFFFVGDQSLAWVIDHQSSEMVRLPASPRDLKRKAKKFTNTVAHQVLGGSDAGLKFQAGELYRLLIAPVSPLLRHSQLIVVPHQFLHSFPFAALWNSDAGRWLIEEVGISLAPSATALARLESNQRSKNDGILVLGNSDGTLPFAALEAEQIAALLGEEAFLRDRASVSLFASRAESSRLLHLAVHGDTDFSNPLNSWLQLAPSGSSQGKLRVRDIYRMDLSGVDLAVLSACKSAVGPVTSGDDMTSPARAFLAAGASTVVASLWQVEDGASAATMTSLYSNLLHNPNKSVAESLRLAQLETLQKDQWAPPYYWAGFVPLGNGWRKSIAIRQNEH